MTQESVAERLSVSRTTFVNIEKGRQRLAVHQLVDLANALGCEAAELLNDDMDSIDEFVDEIRIASKVSR